jgi:hypothetical protein
MIHHHRIHHYRIEGLRVRTGDILCTRDGNATGFVGAIWSAIGALVPGEIDHCALYIGPGGRFAEADARGVSVLAMPGDRWNSDALRRKRLFVDTFVGVAYPLEGRRLSRRQQDRIRLSVATYCLSQAASGKRFNFNLLDATNPRRTYCSQLIVEAYRCEGIDLNSKRGMRSVRTLRRAVLPESLWQGSPHREVGGSLAAGTSSHP